MTPERHERLMACFDEGCDLDAAGQAALVARVAAEDRALGRELAALLRHDRAAPDALSATLMRLGALAQAAAALEIGGPDPAAAAAPQEAAPQLPDLEVLATLAEGGMGRVLLARQRSLARDVAVKVVKAEAASADLVERLLSEAVLAGSLEHPSIVPVHLLERDAQGRPLLVMKRVEGVSWAALIAAPEHPAWAQVPGAEGDRLAAHLAILTSVCNALHFAHSRGVVHRDIKPENVMVGSFGEVYLMDWGIAARLDGTGAPAGAARDAIVGTPGYLAPEMLSPGAGPLDVRTDVYLLGATLHHVLLGRPRHEGRTLSQVLRAARASLPISYGPEVPEDLAAICNRATDRDPARRYESARALQDAIADYLRHRGAIELSDAAEERLRQLRAALAAPQRDAAAVHELSAEVLFGFRQSLRAWPGNQRARQGLRACLLTMVEHEVAEEHLGRAAALLSRVEEPPEELRRRVADLRARLEERAAREARLREIERGQDWSIGARQRVAFFLLASALAVGAWRVAVYPAGVGDAVSPARLAAVMGLWGVGMGILLLIFRRHLLSTTVSRELALGVMCGIGGMFVSRCLQLLPAPTTAAVVSADLVIAATVGAVGALVLARWLALVSLLFLLGAVAARLAPSLAGLALAASGALATLVGLWRLRAQARGQR